MTDTKSSTTDSLPSRHPVLLVAQDRDGVYRLGRPGLHRGWFASDDILAGMGLRLVAFTPSHVVGPAAQATQAPVPVLDRSAEIQNPTAGCFSPFDIASWFNGTGEGAHLHAGKTVADLQAAVASWAQEQIRLSPPTVLERVAPAPYAGRACFVSKI
jgi:hypothetical protein